MRKQLEEYNYREYVENCYKKYLPIKEVYIWGTGQLGLFCYNQLVRNNVSVRAFIDNNKSKQGSKINDCEIIGPDSVDSSILIIICSISSYYIEQQIKSQGNNQNITYHMLSLIDNRFENYCFSYECLFEEIEKNREHLLKLYECYNDEKSIEVLDNVLKFRMTLDSQYAVKAMELSISDGSTQYFDKSIYKFNNQEVFIDCGGYIGDSTIEFIKRCPDYKEIYFFEPDGKIINEAQHNLSQHENINYIMAGTGAENKIEKFCTLGSIGGGTVSEKGDTDIRIVKLDSIRFINAPTFIKMDIEGSEMDTLMGAKEIIRNHKPKMAISVYHKPMDLFEIMNYIKSIVPEYRFYLRHYTSGLADTVMYCII